MWSVHNKNKNGGGLKRKYANKARTWNHCHFLVFVLFRSLSLSICVPLSVAVTKFSLTLLNERYVSGVCVCISVRLQPNFSTIYKKKGNIPSISIELHKFSLFIYYNFVFIFQFRRNEIFTTLWKFLFSESLITGITKWIFQIICAGCMMYTPPSWFLNWNSTKWMKREIHWRY